jgi:hypothetical protein
MSSIWKLDDQDIYVDQFNQAPKGEVAELNPLNSTDSIYHKIYEADDEISFQGTVIGETYESNIRATYLSEVILITDLIPSGFSVFVTNVQSVRTQTMSQFVDLTQSSDAPVYRITVTARVV